MKRTAFVLTLLLVAWLAVAARANSVVAGGSTSPAASGQSVVITGAIAVNSSGQMTVGAFVIVPMTANVPALLRPGDVVIVVGVLQPDGKTIYTDSIILYDDSTPAPVVATPTRSVLPTPISATFVPFPTPVWTPQPTSIPVSDASDQGCDHDGQPVAERIADAFSVSYETVMQMHCAGNGFGEITRAFVLQAKTGVPAWTYLQCHQNGEGWGEIIKDAGVAPSDLAPGQVISQGAKCEDGSGPPGQCKKLNDDGPGNGKCEDGNGPPGQCKKLGDPSNPPGQDPGNGHGNGHGHGG